MRKRSALLKPLLVAPLILGACMAAPASLQPLPGPTEAAISPDDMRLRLGIIAADSMMGRDTGSPGAAATARYLAAEMARLRLQPAGDNGSYLQSVPLQLRRTTSTATAFLEASEPATLDVTQILPVSGLGGLPQASRSSGRGPLIFGGHILDAIEEKDEIGLDRLNNAVVIIRMGLPEGIDPATIEPRLPMASLFSPMSPAAAVLLIAEESEEGFWQYAADTERKGAVELATPSTDPTAPPFFMITRETAEQLLGTGLESARLPRLDLGEFEFAMSDRTEAIEGWNVAAIVPGSDPAFAGEYVGLGAHYDHVGIGIPINGDSIYNGADDNASGTVALLEIAEKLAFRAPRDRPARPTLFVWKTAEEHGLFGSEYFTDHPTVPREQIIAHINLDMVGRNHPDSLGVVGSRRLSTELGDLVDEVNQRQERPFIFDYSFDVPGHPEQIYCRSDHYSYARYGIPIVFFSTGMHEDYHAPSDEIEKIEFEKMARVTEMVYDLTLALGDRPTRPRVDQPVPPLGTPCS